jgi:hypothetical protein
MAPPGEPIVASNGAVADAGSPEEQQPERPRQKRADETAQDARNEDDATSDTSDDDGWTRQVICRSCYAIVDTGGEQLFPVTARTW